MISSSLFYNINCHVWNYVAQNKNVDDLQYPRHRQAGGGVSKFGGGNVGWLNISISQLDQFSRDPAKTDISAKQ